MAKEDRCELLCLDLRHAEEVRDGLPTVEDCQQTAMVAGALADPTRLRVATALATGDELCVCDLAWICGLSQNLASHHARQLRTAGLASSRRDGKLVLYGLTAVGEELLETLLALTAASDADEELEDSRHG